ncbi:type I restriction enzyme, S subunit [Xylanibacter ruminicola]|uniref:Type I restriction enzyme, S subunit n=1 Tax=Xylanibacter ruminicola TaxID=839 RepID=A0A1M7CSP1_XYLRU|nr:restriction endonuclease subunit S [Xylanibacter ruminicola]SHL70246.1 type I restriction enzyme, S subunit [Xylanibacter ruminicola]
MELKKCKIKDICNINSSSISSKDKIEEIIYLDTSNLTQNEINSLQPFSFENAPSRAQRKVKHNTILYSSVRPNQKHYGILSNPEEHMIVSSGFITLDIKPEKVEEYDAMFLYYILTQDWVTSYLQTIAENSVSAYPSINANDLGNLCFSFPNINSQRKIAKSLSNLDRKISLNRSINQNLENLAKQIYDYWFVQFDFPDENGRPYKSSGGQMVYNDKIKREIPIGWEIFPLFEGADVQYGFPFSTELFTDEKTSIPVVRIRDILDGTISAYSSEPTDEKYLLQEGDVVIGMDGNFHMNYWHDNRSYLNQRCVRIRTKAGSVISSTQIFYELKPYIKAKEASVKGSTVGHLSDKDLKGLYLINPQSNRIFDPKKIFDNILSMTIHNRQQIIQLTKQRDELLPLLMNGQVSIK